MTHDEFKAGRLALGLTQSELAAVFHVQGYRTIQKWENGERPITGPVAVLMRVLIHSATGRQLLGLPRLLKQPAE